MNTELSLNLAADNQQQVMGSISIEDFISNRNKALSKIQDALELLQEAGQLTSKIGASDATAWASNHYYKWDNPFAMKDGIQTSLELIAKVIDKDAWHFLMKNSGMLPLMDKQAKDDWRKSLQDGEFAELNVDNIYATFDALNSSKGEVFERGVINVFKALSYCYKTNLPQMFGKKIIKDYVVQYDTFGFSAYYRGRFEQLDDLERVLKILDGQPAPDNTCCLSRKFDNHIHSGSRHDNTPYEDDLFHIKYFKKGTAHITLKRQDLVSQLNLIIAKHYPDALPVKV